MRAFRISYEHRVLSTVPKQRLKQSQILHQIGSANAGRRRTFPKNDEKRLHTYNITNFYNTLTAYVSTAKLTAFEDTGSLRYPPRVLTVRSLARSLQAKSRPHGECFCSNTSAPEEDPRARALIIPRPASDASGDSLRCFDGAPLTGSIEPNARPAHSTSRQSPHDDHVVECCALGAAVRPPKDKAVSPAIVGRSTGCLLSMHIYCVLFAFFSVNVLVFEVYHCVYTCYNVGQVLLTPASREYRRSPTDAVMPDVLSFIMSETSKHFRAY